MGFLWSIEDVVYGNPDKDRKPIKDFVEEVSKYPRLLDIIVSIDGLICKRSSHASGVILYENDPYETSSFMRTPSGDLITCYDLHMSEAGGSTKYDFLVTEISDKIIKCFELLKANNLIEDLPLRDLYNKYIHPEVIDTTDPRIWEHLALGDVLDVFQFATGVGLAIAKKLKPQNPMEMTAANAMMRLMSEKGKESQQDRYVRIKKEGLEVFDKEMRNAHLTETQIALMHKHCDKYYGCCALQEQMMEILMEVVGFSLGEANMARKVVAKKLMSKIPDLKKQVYQHLGNPSQAEYIWETAIAPSLGYAFSICHSLPYSFVGMQTIYFAINFDPIYWNTACLIVNSGAIDEENGGQTDYAKIAKAIGNIRSSGIKISLANINKSVFGFSPDAENNQILFGLKGMLNVGDDLITTIIRNRPYKTIKDFYNRIKPPRQAMISLIKGGAFDEMIDRKFAMAWFIWETCDKKSRLTLQNMPTLIKKGLLDENTPERVMSRRVYEFNRYLKVLAKNSSKEFCFLDNRAINFLNEISCDNLFHSVENKIYINLKDWDKVYQRYMDTFRNWIAENSNAILKNLNDIIFKEDWDKYATGNISSWEMEALCFYYHDHELIHTNQYKYGIVDFFKLPEEPEVERVINKKNGQIRLFKLHRICGTCIAKDKVRSSVTLLTTTGVVNVRFRKEYFSLFDKQISAKGEDGVKHVLEKSWFNRGSMIVVNGMRSGDDFIVKKYTTTPGHQLYKIDEVFSDGTITIRSERYEGEEEDD